jgi:ABC-type dipeptide/oligopeptide/nickel transport system permease component
LLLTAIDNQGFPLIQASTLVVVLGGGVANLVVALLYAALNPWIRYE